MKKGIIKELIVIGLILSMVMTTSTIAFADSMMENYSVNNDVTYGNEYYDEGDEARGWSNWTVRGTYYSNSTITSLINTALWSMLLYGLAYEPVSGVSAAITAIQSILNVGDKVYYKTVTYQRTDGTGRIQMYKIRYVYSHPYYGQLGVITTEIVTYNSTARSDNGN